MSVAALRLSDQAIALDELAARKYEGLALAFGVANEHVRILVAAASAVAFYTARL